MGYFVEYMEIYQMINSSKVTTKAKKLTYVLENGHLSFFFYLIKVSSTRVIVLISRRHDYSCFINKIVLIITLNANIYMSF
jgi:hypothetical protein